MKIIKNLTGLFKARRNSEIDYEYCNYKYNSFFRVLWVKLFGIVTKYLKEFENLHGATTIFNRPGSIWTLSKYDLLKAPLSYLISGYFFGSSDTILKHLRNVNFESL